MHSYASLCRLTWCCTRTAVTPDCRSALLYSLQSSPSKNASMPLNSTQGFYFERYYPQESSPRNRGSARLTIWSRRRVRQRKCDVLILTSWIVGSTYSLPSQQGTRHDRATFENLLHSSPSNLATIPD